jgi:hypothetical protein
LRFAKTHGHSEDRIREPAVALNSDGFRMDREAACPEIAQRREPCPRPLVPARRLAPQDAWTQPLPPIKAYGFGKDWIPASAGMNGRFPHRLEDGRERPCVLDPSYGCGRRLTRFFKSDYSRN